MYINPHGCATRQKGNIAINPHGCATGQKGDIAEFHTYPPGCETAGNRYNTTTVCHKAEDETHSLVSAT